MTNRVSGSARGAAYDEIATKAWFWSAFGGAQYPVSGAILLFVDLWKILSKVSDMKWLPRDQLNTGINYGLVNEPKIGGPTLKWPIWSLVDTY